MKTITLDTIKAMNASTFSVQDNSPRGVKTVTAGIIAIERSRRRPDLWNVWTLERVKSAFSLGHGTPADFRRFVRDNSHYAHFITDPAEIAEFLAKHREEVTA